MGERLSYRHDSQGQIVGHLLLDSRLIRGPVKHRRQVVDVLDVDEHSCAPLMQCVRGHQGQVKLANPLSWPWQNEEERHGVLTEKERKCTDLKTRYGAAEVCARVSRLSTCTKETETRPNLGHTTNHSDNLFGKGACLADALCLPMC